MKNIFDAHAKIFLMLEINDDAWMNEYYKCKWYTHTK